MHEVKARNYVTVNSESQHASTGLAYHFSKLGTDRDPLSIASWGAVVRGVDEEDGWLRVGTCYLPMTLGGKRVIFKAAEIHGPRATSKGSRGELALRDIRGVEAAEIHGRQAAGKGMGELPFSNIHAAEAAEVLKRQAAGRGAGEPPVSNVRAVEAKETHGGQAGIRGAGDFPLGNIRAVEATHIAGGTRIAIVMGEGKNGSNWTEGQTYNLDINESLSNLSSYAGVLQTLRGEMGPKSQMDLNASHLADKLANSRVWASMFHTVNGSHIFVPTGSVIMASDHDKLIPVWEIKSAIAEAVQEGIAKAEAAAKKNHSVPTMDAVQRAVQAEVWGTWDRLAKTMRSTRFKRRDHRNRTFGITVFFKSVPVFDWCLVLFAIFLFSMQHWGLLHWPSTKTFHGTVLVLWFLLAGLYCVLIFKRQGTTEGILWLNGYFLELIFLVENVLVTHIIIQAFRTPKWVNEKALFIVVISRIIFQLVFYMGLAELVFSGDALPYILGVWLLYIAYQAAFDDEDSNLDIMDARVIHLARAAFGERLCLSKDDTGALFVVKENKRRLSMVGLMVFCLVLVDALLHVDVALTKVEELQGNGYLCFSSAAVASFCLPELVFVVRDFFRRFPGFKYGISAVLVYIAVQMLLHAIFRPPIFADLAVFVGCLVLSIGLSSLGFFRRGAVKCVDAGTQACLPPKSDDITSESSFNSPSQLREHTAN